MCVAPSELYDKTEGKYIARSNTGCVSESGDFKNVMNSKCFHLFSCNTYEHNVYTK
jgi:hypothetical protein